jgi:stress response protein YsnF
MRQTIVGVFDKYACARRAVQVLAESGFGPDAVDITEEFDDAALSTDSPRSTSEDDTMTGKIRHFFRDLFDVNDEHEVREFSETIHRGGAIVKVEVDDESRIDAARHALERAGAIDVDEEESGSVSSAAAGSGASALALSTDAGLADLDNAGAARSPGADERRADEQVLPVMREELQVGKRRENVGGVRVFTRPVDKPVEETVTLREERARVDRHAVNREVNTDDRRLGDGQTIEVREYVEKPVVQKVARVVEEVVVGREVREHEEKVRDTVHGTEVQIERLEEGGSRNPVGGERVANGGSQDMSDLYRQDFQTRFASDSSLRYEDAEPAYRYGGTLAEDSRYRGRAWDDIEPDARRDWEGAHPGSAWERFKSAVRHAWESAKR